MTDSQVPPAEGHDAAADQDALSQGLPTNPPPPPPLTPAMADRPVVPAAAGPRRSGRSAAQGPASC